MVRYAAVGVGGWGICACRAGGVVLLTQFPPASWSQTTLINAGGSFYFTGSGSATALTFNASGTTGYSDTIISANNTSGTTESVSFDWTLTANGNMGAPLAYFYVGSTIYDLIGTSGTLTGINVSAGQTIQFELVGDVSSGKAPAQLKIWDVVPETGNALAGMLVLAVSGFEWFRRQRTAGG